MADELAEKLAGLRRLRDSLPIFAAQCLKIRPKDVVDAPLVPLVLNRTQMHVHAIAEAQRARLGRVRMMVGKGRKTTVSTYVTARGYHKTVFTPGFEALIMAHDQDTTDALFEMIDRFHQHSPIRPSTSIDSTKELRFDKLDSSIWVKTAGAKAGGRGTTPQFLQWSEAAHTPNAHEHFSGAVQAIPGARETEVWIETTGAGPSGAYYEHWQDAEAGIGDYVACFAPWYWTEEYTREPPPGFTLTEEEDRRYQRLHKLSLGQMAWRASKIVELRSRVLFKQEYPATAAEMFEGTGQSSYIDPELVMQARKNKLDGYGPLIVGVDPARHGGARFSVAWRRGRKVSKVESRTKIGTMPALACLKDIIDRDKPARMFIDAGGGGDRLFDILQSYGAPYDKIVVLVNFGSAPNTEVLITKDGTKRAGPANRRAEMWMNSLQWLEQPGGADVPDIDSLQGDAAAPGFHYRTTDQRLVLESKEDIEARGVRSPDEWDAIALTFAEPVKDRPEAREPRRPQQQTSAEPSQSWMGA